MRTGKRILLLFTCAAYSVTSNKECEIDSQRIKDGVEIQSDTKCSDTDSQKKRENTMCVNQSTRDNSTCTNQSTRDNSTCCSQSVEEKLILTFRFIKRLNVVMKLIEKSLGTNASYTLRNAEIPDNVKSEIEKCIFPDTENATTTLSALRALTIFDKRGCVSSPALLFPMLELSERLEYAFINDLYNETLVFFYYGVVRIEEFVLLREKDTGKIKDSDTILGKTAEAYREMKEKYVIVWKTSVDVLVRLFSRERILGFVNNFCTGIECGSFLDTVKSLLRLRVLVYPEECGSYLETMELYSIEEVENVSFRERGPENVSFCEEKVEPVLLKIKPDKVARINKKLFCYRWNNLTIKNRKQVSDLFYCRKNIEVNVLSLVGNVNTRFERSGTKYKVVVKKKLILIDVEGEIDFVDTTVVEWIHLDTIYEELRFYDTTESRMFENVKKVNIYNSDISVLVKDDGSPLFPNAEILLITQCILTESIFTVISQRGSLISIVDCQYNGNVQTQRIIERLEWKNLCVIKEEEYVFRLNVDESMIREIESRYSVEGLERYNNGIVHMNLTLSDIQRLVVSESRDQQRLKERIRTSIVSVTNNLCVKINLTRCIEREITFLEVKELELYVKLKRICTLASLVHLKVLKVAKKLRKSDKTTTHSLRALIVSNVTAEKAEDAIKALFEKEKLEFLLVQNTRSNETYQQLLQHFTKIKVLSIEIEISEERISQLEAILAKEERLKAPSIDVEISEEQLPQLEAILEEPERLKAQPIDVAVWKEQLSQLEAILEKIERLSSLEVLEIKIENAYNGVEMATRIIKSVKRILDGCKNVKRLTIKLEELEKHVRTSLDPIIKTCDARKYHLNIKMNLFAYNLNDSIYFYMKEMNKTLYEKIVIANGCYELYDERLEFERRILKIEYVLVL